MKLSFKIFISFIVPFLLNAQTPCNNTCKRIVDIDTNQLTGDLNCTLTSSVANMPIIAKDVFEADGKTLKTYFGTGETVCNVLGWMNFGAGNFSRLYVARLCKNA